MPTPEQIAQAQARAVQQFREWAADARVLVVDTETTGLQGSVWEFAAVRLHSPTPVLAFICDPSAEWSERAAEMHAGRLDEVHAAPHAEDVQDVLEHVLDYGRVLTYGADFDHSAISRTWPGIVPCAFECILTAYAPLAGRWSESRGEWKYVSLGDALELERVDVRHLPAAHSAYGDALRAALLVQAVAARETDAEREYREDIEAAERHADAHGDGDYLP